jgi:hypothetical protein
MRLLSALCAGLVAATAAGSPIGYETFRHGSNTYHIVTADLSSGRVRPKTVHTPGLSSVWQLLAQQQPSAAITGTFFSTTSGHPIADLLVDGRLVAQGNRGSGIGVDWYGGVRIFDESYRRQVEWSEFQWGLRGAIRVVTKGTVHPNPQAQAFTDRRLWGRAARTGVGLTRHGKLVLVATKGQVTLSEFGNAMVSRGVQEAIGLDGGGSTCLYYKGSLVIPPSRKLSNMFVISEASAGWANTSMGNVSANRFP